LKKIEGEDGRSKNIFNYKNIEMENIFINISIVLIIFLKKKMEDEWKIKKYF